ncbi:transmembrane sensor/regulator PpyR [Halomonas sp. Bachu 37]|uniref:hypothetical protein n=1 Tax=Halomonas kashgarensis TaxID=3084920 RepID=UPI0032165A3B
MKDLFANSVLTQQVGNATMLVGLLLLVGGLLGGYVWHSHLTLLQQVSAHVIVIVGPTLIKIGYVMRINARQRLKLAY